MYCIKCGSENSSQAVYCRKCGALIAEEEETHVAVRDENALADKADAPDDDVSDLETPIFSTGPTLKFVKAGYVGAAVGALLLVAVLGIFAVRWWISLIIGLLLFLIPGYQHLKARLIRYSMTGSQIEVDSGLISRTTRNIPLRRIQDVTVSTSVLQRVLGYGDLVIDNASEDGGKIVLKNIDSPKRYAEMLLKQIRRLER